MSELAVGLAESLISASLFGSCFVLIKKRGIGDGMFAQWAMSCAIFMSGFVVMILRGFPRYHPFASLGGVSYAVGNALIIPIINEIGMGPAFLLPDTINCIGNFLVGYFGLFYTHPRPPQTLWMALIGLILILIGGVLISQVENKKEQPCLTTATTASEVEDVEGNEPDLKISVVMPPEKTKSLSDSEPSLWHLILEIVKRLRRPLFVALALFIGVFYVMCLTTIIAVIDSPDVFGYDNPKDSLSYVFSHYTALFVTSTVIFIGYSICKKNRPNINPEIFLPGFGGGIMWSIGMIFWLLSADNLSQSITGPITAMMPGCVASLWSVFYFKEIEYGKNLYMLCAAITFTLTGSVVIGLSK
ncbi:transmembrane family of transporters domain-containing protein [Ditylenchus destructor]|uniref:Transmembrane family of transporters domain-containing protein n=1 Tax=Ditylenchus destructor TaxID=166010 RepID=A0AAD4MRF2_9BILA|nr:transmembrane family of transporters domain-containing protein [Ditylenchus destructor]